MSKKKSKTDFLYELLASAADLGLHGSEIRDKDGTIIGIVIGEKEVVDAYGDDEQNKILH